MPFQTQVNETAGVGVPGDFSDHGPRTAVPAGPGGLKAGPAGVYIGRFAWLSPYFLDWDDAPAVLNSFGTGMPAGIVANEMQTTLTVFLDEYTYVVKAGYNITAYNNGSFWVKNEGTTTALPNQKVYAGFADGKISAAATASPTQITAATSSIAAATNAFTGGISDNVLTVTAVSSGSIYPGTTVAGGTTVSGTKVMSQFLPLLTGETAAGVGRYAVNIAGQSVAAGTSLTGGYGVLTLGATPSGAFGAGQVLSGSSVATGTTVTQLLTGSPTVSGATFAVDNNTVVGSTTITANLNYETKWVVMSPAAAGGMMKISSWTLG